MRKEKDKDKLRLTVRKYCQKYHPRISLDKRKWVEVCSKKIEELYCENNLNKPEYKVDELYKKRSNQRFKIELLDEDYTEEIDPSYKEIASVAFAVCVSSPEKEWKKVDLDLTKQEYFQMCFNLIRKSLIIQEEIINQQF